MIKFNVLIKETAIYSFEVEAPDSDWAMEIAGDALCNASDIDEYFVEVSDREIELIEEVQSGYKLDEIQKKQLDLFK